MTTVACRACGTQIKYGEKHAGKAVKCPKCGEAVLLPVILAATEDLDLAYGLEPDISKPTPTAGMGPPELANTNATLPQAMPRRLSPERVQRGFWADARKSFTFLSEMDNAVVVVGYAALMTVYAGFALIPVFGFFATFFFYGMLFAFYFDIVQATAGGEDDLPTIADWDGFVSSALAPVLKFIGTVVVVLIPGIVATLVIQDRFGGVGVIVIAAIFAVGWFLWPVVVLAVSTIGYELVFRVDLIVRTPFAAFGAYLVVCALLLVALSFEWLGSSAFLSDTSHQAMAAMRIESGSVLGFVFTVFELFVLNAIGISSSVISMRLIGLYYRHFSDRFPWSAG